MWNHRSRVITPIALLLGTFAGCGQTSAPPAAPAPPAVKTTASKVQAARDQPQAVRAEEQPATSESTPTKPPAPRQLADLVDPSAVETFGSGPVVAPHLDVKLPEINAERVAAAGIRKLTGKHLTLYTDLPSAPAVDELPAVFDAALPQWNEYFQIDAARSAAWQLVGYLVHDKERFRAVGLWPDDLPQFLHGFQRGSELWLYEQPSDYYRRHLLLHEGTHGFMNHLLGGAGPPWYMEGTAELLATHRWAQGQLTMRWFPNDKTLTEYWGRIKKVREELAASRGKTLEEIMLYDATAHLRVEPYAWCWAAAAFFDGHPQWQPAFRELRKFAPDTSSTFSARFHDSLRDAWPRVVREWQLFIFRLDYGYDVARESIDVQAAEPLPAEGATVTIMADRGWQSSGYLLEAGTKYKLAATGRYQIGDQPQVWWCEPNGVTIRYHQGRPLGMLLGAVVDEQAPRTQLTPLLTPDPIGLGREVSVEADGTLFLRINELPSELADNAGSLEVRIERLAEQ